MGYKSDKVKKEMIEALENSLGVVSTACKAMNISRQTHYEWLREDPEYKAAVEDVNQATKDFGESQLHLLMKGVYTQREDGDIYRTAPNPAAVIFFNKTRNKDRGYIETHDLRVSDNPPNFLFEKAE